MTGVSCRASLHWPEVISSAEGRRPPSPARWILQVRPPRERPSPPSRRCCGGVRLSPALVATSHRPRRRDDGPGRRPNPCSPSTGRSGLPHRRRSGLPPSPCPTRRPPTSVCAVRTPSSTDRNAQVDPATAPPCAVGTGFPRRPCGGRPNSRRANRTSVDAASAGPTPHVLNLPAPCSYANAPEPQRSPDPPHRPSLRPRGASTPPRSARVLRHSHRKHPGGVTTRRYHSPDTTGCCRR